MGFAIMQAFSTLPMVAGHRAADTDSFRSYDGCGNRRGLWSAVMVQGKNDHCYPHYCRQYFFEEETGKSLRKSVLDDMHGNWTSKSETCRQNNLREYLPSFFLYCH